MFKTHAFILIIHVDNLYVNPSLVEGGGRKVVAPSFTSFIAVNFNVYDSNLSVNFLNSLLLMVKQKNFLRSSKQN